MNDHIEKQYGSLDYANKNVADQLIKQLADIQAKSELNFQKIKHVNMIKTPFDYFINVAQYKRNIDSSQNEKQLTNTKDKIISELKDLRDKLEYAHLQNVDAIESNKNLNFKIKDLFAYIGVRDEYIVVEHKGTKQKSSCKKAGYLSDLQTFCIVDDGYSMMANTINLDIKTIEKLCSDKAELLKSTAKKSEYTKLYYLMNAHAHNINKNIIDIDDFISLKGLYLTFINAPLGSLYESKINDYEGSDIVDIDDFESGVVDDIIFYNTINIDSNTRSILEFNYQDYTTIKTGLIG